MIALLLEGYLDFAVGCAANIGYLRWESWEDIVNGFFVVLLVPVILLTPILAHRLLTKNVERLNGKDFQQHFGAFYDGLRVDLHLNRNKTMYVAAWFTLRRLLLAMVIVFLADAPVVFPIFAFIQLTLIDYLIKYSTIRCEDQLSTIMERVNDVIVLFASYFLFLWTDIISDEKLRY